MAINKLVSVKSAVFEALEDMGIDNTKDVPVFTRWAITAEKEIGSYYSYRRKTCVIKVANCKAKLPCEAVAVKLVIGGSHLENCGQLAERAINLMSTDSSSINNETINNTFLIVDVLDTTSGVCLGSKWELQNDFIVFKNTVTFTECTVDILCLEQDCDGFPLVCENHKEAITEYIMYRFGKRSRFTSIKMDAGDVMRHFEEWNRLCAHSRALDSQLSESDRREIVAMLHDPMSGIGSFLNFDEFR